MISCCGLKEVLWAELIRVAAIFYAEFEKVILYCEVCLGGTHSVAFCVVRRLCMVRIMMRMGITSVRHRLAERPRGDQARESTDGLSKDWISELTHYQ